MKAGSLGAQVRKEKIVVSAGGTAIFSAGVVHSWWNAGKELLELSGWSSPAGDLERFLQALFLNADATGRPSIFYLAHVLWRHRYTQAVMTPPRAIQRIVFFPWFCWSVAFWANTEEFAGRVHPNRA